MLTIVNAGLASKVGRPEPIAIRTHPASMKPRTHHQHVKDSGILLFDMLIGRERAKQIFIVVPTADGHYRRVNVLQVRQDVSLFPKLIVVGMQKQLVPEFRSETRLL